MDLLRALVADLLAQRPDHIAMTGDILNIGLPAEFPAVRFEHMLVDSAAIPATSGRAYSETGGRRTSPATIRAAAPDSMIGRWGSGPR